jgi:hypothetical protein
LKSTFVHIQYEGYELLKDLALITAIQDAVLVALVTILKIPGANVDHAAENKPGKDKRKGNAQEKTSNLDTSESFMTVVYIQQTYAAKLVGYLAATNRAIGERLICIDVIPGLLNSVANICHAECQKNAASSLQV